jgi:hypothetical protein
MDIDALASINKEGNKFSDYLNQFILNKAPTERMKQKLEEQQKEMSNRDANFLGLST